MNVFSTRLLEKRAPNFLESELSKVTELAIEKGYDVIGIKNQNNHSD